MSSDYWILDEAGEPKSVGDVLEWGAWFETANRHVADETVDGQRVSTIFLGLDHSFGGAAPVLYELMVFGGPHDGYQERYSCRADALNRHRAIVALLAVGGSLSD